MKQRGGPPKIQSKSEKEERLALVWRLWNRGRTQFEIAKEVGISDRQVRYDLKTLEIRWRQESSAGIAAHKERQLARNEEIFRENWSAWLRSLEEKLTTATEQSDDSGGKGHKKASLKREQKEGNPAFLAGAAAAIERHCKILGIPMTTLSLANLPTEELIRLAQTVFGAVPGAESGTPGQLALPEED
jgi:hypothetical protein